MFDHDRGRLQQREYDVKQPQGKVFIHKSHGKVLKLKHPLVVYSPLQELAGRGGGVTVFDHDCRQLQQRHDDVEQPQGEVADGCLALVVHEERDAGDVVGEDDEQ